MSSARCEIDGDSIQEYVSAVPQCLLPGLTGGRLPEWAGLLPVSQLEWSGGLAELRLGVGGPGTGLNPRPAAPGTPIPVRGRIGNRGFPVSIPPAFLDSGESESALSRET